MRAIVCYSMALLVSCLTLSGCGSQDKDDATTGGAHTSSYHPASEEVGPQYQTPTMDVLQGKPQQFPAKYPVRRYPNSRVKLAYVRPDLRPGQKNYVLLSATDAQDTIAGYYKKTMLADGYKLAYTFENAEMSRTVWERTSPDGKLEEAEVRVYTDPTGKRTVQLLSGPYKKRFDFSQNKPDDQSDQSPDSNAQQEPKGEQN